MLAKRGVGTPPDARITAAKSFASKLAPQGVVRRFDHEER